MMNRGERRTLGSAGLPAGPARERRPPAGEWVVGNASRIQ